jgi:hypothetical protein
VEAEEIKGLKDHVQQLLDEKAVLRGKLDRYHDWAKDYRRKYKEGIDFAKTMCKLPLVSKLGGPIVIQWLESLRPRNVELDG